MDTAVQEQQGGLPRVAQFAAIWHVLMAVALAALSFQIISLDDFLSLGRPVQIFAALIVLVPAVAGLAATFWLLRGDGRGRYTGIALNYGGLALSLFALLGIWGVFNSFERIVDGIMANATLTLGFALAYGLFWAAGRFLDAGAIQERVQQFALIIGMITLVILILLSNLLGGIGHVLGTYANPLTWFVTVIAVIFGFLAWRLLQLSDYFDETPDERTAWQGWLMLSPNIIGFLIFFAAPLAFSFYLSFTDDKLDDQAPQVIGFGNYAELLSLQFKMQDTRDLPAQDALDRGFAVAGSINWGEGRLVIGAQDRQFWVSLRNTIVFVLMLLPLAIIPALGMSLVLNSSLPGVKFYRAIYFLPSVAAVVGTALIWRWLYDPIIGTFNYVIGSTVTWLNINLGLSLMDPNIQWLTGPGVVLFSIVLLSAWQVVGYNTVLFLAGLQGIPGTLYEAAQIDGANRWQQFRNVTLPMLAPTTFFVMITTMVTGLQVFNEPFALFPARPIPEQATTSVFYMYDQAFPKAEFGYSSAIAWILFAIIFGLTLLQFRFSNNDAYE